MAAAQEKRGEVLAALLRITKSDGLDAVSVRTVADAAGCSMGYVQRQFRTKEELLYAAFEACVRILGLRLNKMVAEIEPGTSGRVVLSRVAATMLPSAPKRLEEGRTWLAFFARALVAPGLGTLLRQHYDSVQQLFVAALTLAQQQGETSSELDMDLEATAFFALLDGLTAQQALGRCDPEKAARVVSTHLERLFR